MKVEMTYYHGSPVGGITTLKPNISNHNDAYVYFSSNPVVALFYTVRIHFYPYGFSKESKVPKYFEYYKDALKDVFSNKVGYLYECEDINIVENPTNIFCAYVSREPVRVKECRVISDVYEEMLRFEDEKLFEIRRYKDIGKEELKKYRDMVFNTIKSGDLYQKDDEYSNYMRTRFPEEWEKARKA